MYTRSLVFPDAKNAARCLFMRLNSRCWRKTATDAVAATRCMRFSTCAPPRRRTLRGAEVDSVML